MLLHEELSRDTNAPRARLARHFYDLWCLIRAGWADQALEDQGLFQAIADHRAVFFRKNVMTRNSLRQGTLLLVPSSAQLPGWRRDYEAMRDTMFWIAPPRFDELVETARRFQERFNRME
jgi:hypothetical protein